MPVVAQIFAVAAALLHVAIFTMESVLWTRPAVYRRFGVASDADALTTKPLAFNQGFYNLFLAVGIIVGVVIGGDAGLALVAFGCACIVAAAAVLASTGRQYLRAASTQALFAIIALVLLFVAW